MTSSIYSSSLLLPPLLKLKPLPYTVSCSDYAPTFSFVLLCSVFDPRTKNFGLVELGVTIRLCLIQRLQSQFKSPFSTLPVKNLMPIGSMNLSHFLYLITLYTGKRISSKFYLKSLPSKLLKIRLNLILKITLIRSMVIPVQLNKLKMAV